MNKCDFAYYLTNFLTVYLPGHLNSSTNTIMSYRDTFSKLLSFCKQIRGIAPEKMIFKHFNRKLIEDFLIWLENEHHCSIPTRNQRLSAIRSFFRYVQIEAPEQLMLCQSIISIIAKKSSKPVINYLTYDGIKTVLAQPDIGTQSGRRDLTLLQLLYDTAARVQEICDLTVRDVRLAPPATVKLHGKGDKYRYVPISTSTVKLLEQYVIGHRLNLPESLDRPLFCNRIKEKLTRGGIKYILDKYITLSRFVAPTHIPAVITPHCIRHSKSMHLLESGVNIIYIRDFLGHEDVKTTERYAKANPEMKRNALLKAFKDLTPQDKSSWNEDIGLMNFLQGIGK